MSCPPPGSSSALVPPWYGCCSPPPPTICPAMTNSFCGSFPKFGNFASQNQFRFFPAPSAAVLFSMLKEERSVSIGIMSGARHSRHSASRSHVSRDLLILANLCGCWANKLWFESYNWHRLESGCRGMGGIKPAEGCNLTLGSRSLSHVSHSIKRVVCLTCVTLYREDGMPHMCHTLLRGWYASQVSHFIKRVVCLTCVRTRRGINGKIWPELWSHILPNIPCLVLIQIQYTPQCETLSRGQYAPHHKLCPEIDALSV